MIIRWLGDAVYDLQSLRRYIAQDNLMASNRMAKKVLDAVQMLSDQPEIGRQGRVMHTRELVITNTPYIVPYRVKNNVIEVLRVLHSAMQWPDEF